MQCQGCNFVIDVAIVVGTIENDHLKCGIWGNSGIPVPITR